MNQTEVQKACHVCGDDVTHKSRHKNRHGQYVCSKCMGLKKRSSEHHGWKCLGMSPKLLAGYIGTVVVGCWFFYRCLGMAVNMLTESP